MVDKIYFLVNKCFYHNTYRLFWVILQLFGVIGVLSDPFYKVSEIFFNAFHLTDY